MPIALRAKVVDLGVSKRIRRMIRAGTNVKKPLLRTGLYVARRGRERLGKSRRNKTSTNRLAASLSVRAEPQQATISSALPYAAVQQLGHPGIRPKAPRKFLAIPQTAALRRSGTWPRDFPEGKLRFVPLPSGKALLVERPPQAVGKRRRRGRAPRPREQVMFLLHPGPIKIPAKHYLRMGKEERARARKELTKHFGLDKR